MPDASSDIAGRFVILLAHERSGSHFLADMLTATAQIKSFDEVCNFNAVNPDTSPVSFFRFRREMQISDPDVVLRPSFESMTRLLDAYFAHVAKAAPAKPKILIDIKYGHVHNFEIGWWPSERRPFLLDHLQRRGMKIVHLTRRDSLAAIASGLIADKVRVWHRREGEAAAAPTPKLRLPAMKAVHDALALEREKENFFAWLANNSSFDVEYERIAGDPLIRHAVMTELCDFLDISAPKEFHSIHRKVTPPLSTVVENYDELVRVVQLFGGGRLRFEAG